jgi:hypothetical protein
MQQCPPPRPRAKNSPPAPNTITRASEASNFGAGSLVESRRTDLKFGALCRPSANVSAAVRGALLKCRDSSGWEVSVSRCCQRDQFRLTTCTPSARVWWLPSSAWGARCPGWTTLWTEGTEPSRTALGCDSTCARSRSRTDHVTSDGYVLGRNYDHEIVGQRPGKLGQDCRSREYVIGWGTFGRAGGRLQFVHHPEQPIMSSGRRPSPETRPPHPPLQAAARDLSNTSRLTRLNAQTDRR